MEPGLKLLTQLILEFAPIAVSLIHKRTEESLATTNYQLPKTLQEFAQSVNISTHINNYVPEFAQEKLLQQQLAVYHRETQLQIAKQERDTVLNLPEVNKILDSWPLRPGS